MSCSCDSFGDAAEHHFTSGKVSEELRRYRDKGPGPTARRLRDGLAAAGLTTGALLDVGAGLGVLTLDLLDLGMSRAVVVEASSAYLSWRDAYPLIDTSSAVILNAADLATDYVTR